MELWFWPCLDNLTTRWHPGGGLLVVAGDAEGARERIAGARDEGGYENGYLALGPDAVPWSDAAIHLTNVEGVEAGVYVMPDAGCC